MARHRQDAHTRAIRPPVPDSSSPLPPGALPRQEFGDQHPSGPLPRLDRDPRDGTRRVSSRAVDPAVDPAAAARPGKHRSSDPDTTPLDLAAIALAAASARTTAVPASTGSFGPVGTGPATGATPLGPEHRTYRPAPRRPRALLPARAAGALAIMGAIAGAGVAAAGGGTMLAADDAPDSGEFRLPDGDPALAGLAAPATGSRATTETETPEPTATRRSAPERTVSTAPAPVREVAGRTLWSADFGTAGLDRFRSTTAGEPGSAAPRVSGDTVEVALPEGGSRSMIEPAFERFREGDEYHVGFSVRLGDDFPVDAPGRQVITRFASDDGAAAPLEVAVRDGRFVLEGGDGALDRTLGSAVPGRWTQIVLEVRFSATDGRVSAWQDGRPTLTDDAVSTGTIRSGQPGHLELGLARGTATGGPAELAFGRYAIGTGLGAVDRATTPAG